MLAAGESPVVDASLFKDLGTLFEQTVPSVTGEDLGSLPDEQVAVPLLQTLHYVTRIAPSYSLRGGTREVLRGAVARDLGLR